MDVEIIDRETDGHEKTMRERHMRSYIEALSTQSVTFNALLDKLKLMHLYKNEYATESVSSFMEMAKACDARIIRTSNDGYTHLSFTHGAVTISFFDGKNK